MTYIKVKDKDYLERDTYSHGIVNTNFEEYERYVQSYKQKKSELVRITKLEEDMNNIKGDLTEIKSLLLGLFKNESK